jgi:hypothetical protein
MSGATTAAWSRRLPGLDHHDRQGGSNKPLLLLRSGMNAPSTLRSRKNESDARGLDNRGGLAESGVRAYEALSAVEEANPDDS